MVASNQSNALATAPLYGTFSVFKQEGIRQFYCRWSQEEDDLLTKAIKKYGCHKWSLISQSIPGRTPSQCSTRYHGALNSKIHKGRWSKDEDDILLEQVHGYLKKDTNEANLPWNCIAQQIPSRTGIQCQSRWTEALNPTVRKGRWNKDEDKLLRQAVDEIGCCWIRVANCIPSRTQRQCRTRWNQIKSTRRSGAAALQHQSVKEEQKSTLSSSLSQLTYKQQQQQQHDLHQTLKSPFPESLFPCLSSNNRTLSRSVSPPSYSSSSSCIADMSPPPTPPRSIPAMIIPTSDASPPLSTSLTSFLSLPSIQLSSQSSSSPCHPDSTASITIPKDPFSFLFDHDIQSTYDFPPSSSSLQRHTHSLDSSLAWFYDSTS